HLDHHLVADDRRAVGLLRRGVTHLAPFRQLDVRQLWQRLETDFPFTAAQHLLVAQALNDAQHELLEGEGVGQQSHLLATANTRDGQLLRQRRTEVGLRSEERRVGKESSCRWRQDHYKRKEIWQSRTAA